MDTTAGSNFENKNGQTYLSSEDRKPSLPEKIDILNKWFSKAAKGKNYLNAELNILEVAEFLVTKGLVSDKDTGIKHILKSLNFKDKKNETNLIMNYAMF